MKYGLLIYAEESKNDQSEATMGRWWALDGAIKGAGIGAFGDALHPVATAKTVRVRDGKVATTDGPFAETKEQFGGFYVIDVPDLDAAIEWAKRIPSVEWGSIEIRPIVDFSAE